MKEYLILSYILPDVTTTGTLTLNWTDFQSVVVGLLVGGWGLGYQCTHAPIIAHPQIHPHIQMWNLPVPENGPEAQDEDEDEDVAVHETNELK